MIYAFYDPSSPFINDYVSRMYFQPLREFAKEKGIPTEEASHLCPTKGRAMVCNADYLTSGEILHFKECGCPLYVFSCIDSAWLSEAIRYDACAVLIDRIFAVTGVQNTNISKATTIGKDFSIGTEERRFLPDGNWETFDFMRKEGTLVPLPYVQWSRHSPPPRLSFKERRPTALFRGGNHFLRVLAFYFALQRGFADPASGFQTRDYFREDMNPDFRYCRECRAIFEQHHGRYPNSAERYGGCLSPAEWGGGEVDIPIPSKWNNRCPASYYWLAGMFAKKHGPISMQAVEDAMNFVSETEQDHLATVGKMRFYADCKWEFSIHAAQRFWEAASVGTINLLPRRANDQEYFPVMRDGEHYLTFADDFSDFSADISEEQFEYVSNNAYQLWEHWMKPTEEYAISPNLCEHIFKLMGHE